MYKIIITIVLFLIPFSNNIHSQEKNNYEIGGQMFTYPKVDWIKGSPVTNFSKDSIYIIELWATWCVPCIMALPHLNELSKKFNDKFIFIAQGVWEENKSKVEEFVKKRGDDYNLRFSFSNGFGSDFDKEWCIPAGIKSIPCTFVIRNNKLVWITRPDKLNEEVMQLLRDDKFTVDEGEAIAKKNK